MKHVQQRPCTKIIRFRRGGGSVRYIIAVVIALIGLIGYFTSTQENPVTGEKQRVKLSVEQEMALGLQAAPEMAQQMGGVVDPNRDPGARLVAQVGQRLVQRSEAAKSPYVEHFQFYLLADGETVNAFALPGGPIFITRALLNRLENEAQLAGVLGHEIGHVINRHAAEHMAQGQLSQMLAAAAGVASSDQRGGGYGAAVLTQMVGQVVQLKYGRDDELESDHYGLRYMVAAGYDPSSMVRVMEILQEASQGSGRAPGFMATHPHPESRIAGIQKYLAEKFPNGIPPELGKGQPLAGLAGRSPAASLGR